MARTLRIRRQPTSQEEWSFALRYESLVKRTWQRRHARIDLRNEAWQILCEMLGRYELRLDEQPLQMLLQLAKMAMRKARRRSNEELTDQWGEEVVAVTDEDRLLEPEEQSALEAAIWRLPADERQIIQWHMLQKRTLVELAERTGLHRESLRRRLRRALHSLRKELSSNPHLFHRWRDVESEAQRVGRKDGQGIDGPADRLTRFDRPESQEPVDRSARRRLCGNR